MKGKTLIITLIVLWLAKAAEIAVTHGFYTLIFTAVLPTVLGLSVIAKIKEALNT